MRDPIRDGTLGCIADDITGAADLAGLLADRDIPTVQLFGVPRHRLHADATAAVVALKSRTAPPAEARHRSRDALIWLRKQRIDRFFFKYCSTFDSTPEGNIGPVTDELLDATGSRFALHCPTYPANGRTVYQGHLFVGDSLLHETGMRDHPLTPMTDANLVRLLQAQTNRPVGLLPLDAVRAGVTPTRTELADLRAHGYIHVIADATSDADLQTLAAAADRETLLAGGAPFGAHVGRRAARHRHAQPKPIPPPTAPLGESAIIAGSASIQTQRQIDAYASHGPTRRLDAARLAANDDLVAETLGWARAHTSGPPVLIAADARADSLARARALLGADTAAAIVERALAEIARGLVAQGVRRLVVAGGETSGAVAQALGIDQVRISRSICPGVPWAFSEDPAIAVAFKSGNFGPDTFFEDAFTALHSYERDRP